MWLYPDNKTARHPSVPSLLSCSALGGDLAGGYTRPLRLAVAALPAGPPQSTASSWRSVCKLFGSLALIARPAPPRPTAPRCAVVLVVRLKHARHRQKAKAVCCQAVSSGRKQNRRGGARRGGDSHGPRRDSIRRAVAPLLAVRRVAGASYPCCGQLGFSATKRASERDGGEST